MADPSISLIIDENRHKIKYNESLIIPHDDLNIRVDIPIVCNDCNTRQSHTVDLSIFDEHERQMGNESFMHNAEDDFQCSECNSLLTAEVEVNLYAENFVFNHHNLVNCRFAPMPEE